LVKHFHEAPDKPLGSGLRDYSRDTLHHNFQIMPSTVNSPGCSGPRLSRGDTSLTPSLAAHTRTQQRHQTHERRTPTRTLNILSFPITSYKILVHILHAICRPGVKSRTFPSKLWSLIACRNDPEKDFSRILFCCSGKYSRLCDHIETNTLSRHG